jgi:peroxiredoxin
MVARAAIKTLILISILVLADAGTSAAVNGGSLVGSRAPEFALKDMSGSYVSVTALRGKVVVINFWATWCPPCRLEMPALNRLYKDYRDRGLVVIAVTTESSERGIKNYLKETHLSLPIVLDRDGRVSRVYGVFSLPTSFVIDRSGTVVLHYMGDQNWDGLEVRSKIEALLERKARVPGGKPEASPVIFYKGHNSRNSF